MNTAISTFLFALHQGVISNNVIVYQLISRSSVYDIISLIWQLYSF